MAYVQRVRSCMKALQSFRSSDASSGLLFSPPSSTSALANGFQCCGGRTIWQLQYRTVRVLDKHLELTLFIVHCGTSTTNKLAVHSTVPSAQCGVEHLQSRCTVPGQVRKTARTRLQRGQQPQPWGGPCSRAPLWGSALSQPRQPVGIPPTAPTADE